MKSSARRLNEIMSRLERIQSALGWERSAKTRREVDRLVQEGARLQAAMRPVATPW